MANPVDLDRLDALRQMASRLYALSPSTLTTNPDMARKWAKEVYDTYPVLAAELRTLRAQVAELEDDSEALEDGTRAYLDLTAERDLLRAERDAARDEAAGLREALKSINRLDENGNSVIKGWSEIDEIIRTALTRTPAQHRARIVAAGLLEAAEKWINEAMIDGIEGRRPNLLTGKDALAAIARAKGGR